MRRRAKIQPDPPRADTNPATPAQTVPFRITTHGRGFRNLNVVLRAAEITYGTRHKILTNSTVDLVVTPTLLDAVVELKHYGDFRIEPTEAMLAIPAGSGRTINP